MAISLSGLAHSTALLVAACMCSEIDQTQSPADNQRGKVVPISFTHMFSKALPVCSVVKQHTCLLRKAANNQSVSFGDERPTCTETSDFALPPMCAGSFRSCTFIRRLERKASSAWDGDCAAHLPTLDHVRHSARVATSESDSGVHLMFPPLEY